jgi:hypothetical protein
MGEQGGVSVARVPEAVTTYDQVILSQINYCTKLSGLVVSTSTGTVKRVADLEFCVNSLISLLPIEMRLKLEERLRWFKQWVLERASRYECFKKKTCGEEREYWETMIKEIYREAKEAFPGYSHTINGFIAYVVWPYDQYFPWIIIYNSLFKLTLIIDMLAEEGIIGLKQPSLYVGGIKNVPKQSD